MKPIIRIVSIITIFILCFDVCTSATVYTFPEDEKVKLEEMFKLQREYHVGRRATLLQFSDETKQEICEDIIGSDSFKWRGNVFLDQNKEKFNKIVKELYPNNEEILSLSRREREKFEPDYHIKIVKPTLLNLSTTDGHEFSFSCRTLAVEEKSNSVSTVDFLIINGYLLNTFFVAEWKSHPDDLRLSGYAELTPKYNADWDQKKLETFYVDMRDKIEELRSLSKRTVRIMEENDDIRNLDSNGKVRLCASIFATKFYKDQSVVFEIKNENVDLEYSTPRLGFRSEAYKTYTEIRPFFYRTDGILCKAYKEGEGTPFKIYVTRSYFQNGSAFVFRHQEISPRTSLHYLDVFLYDIPALLNYSPPRKIKG